MTYGIGKYTYELVDGWAKLPEGEVSFFDVPGLQIDSQDRLYLLTRGAHPLMLFDHEGNLLTAWGEESFGRPHGFCVGPDGSIYCADVEEHTISKYTLKGELLLRLGNRGQPSDSGFVWEARKSPDNTVRQGAPPFNRPTDVALSPSGEIYVSDGYGNARIHKFAYDGTLLLSWGEPGSDPGQFKTPHAIWIDRQERVWVADRENNRIQIFNAQGGFLGQLTDFNRPCGIFIDEDEEVVYVSELGRRVSILDINGKLLARFSSKEQDKKKALFAPHSIAVDSQGNMYVGEVSYGADDIVDRGTRTVQKLQKFTRKSWFAGKTG